MADTWDDTRFLSYEAQLEFYTRVSSDFTPEEQQRLYAVLGNRSQFLPEMRRVLSFDDAVTHVREWDAYEQGEGKVWRQRLGHEPKKPGRLPGTPKKSPENLALIREAKAAIKQWEAWRKTEVRLIHEKSDPEIAKWRDVLLSAQEKE